MEKLKCSSCGGEITVDEDKEYGTCPYCGTKYKLNEDINFNIKIDDNVKEVLNTGLNTAKHFSKFLVIPIIMFIILVISLVIFGIVSSFRADKQRQERINQQREEAKKTQEKIENVQEQIMDKIQQSEENNKADEEKLNKNMFNIKFFGSNGTQNAVFVKATLDNIVQSNKTYDRKVVLVFDGRDVTEESEIISIKQSLSGDYEVSLDYDEDGYIYKIRVEKLN